MVDNLTQALGYLHAGVTGPKYGHSSELAPRSLPCGHPSCKGCLTRSANATNPRGSIDVSLSLTASKASWLRSSLMKVKLVTSSSQNRRHQPPHPHRSPDTNSRSLIEDVDEAKRRAQAGYQI
ncbi:uncharacterized protein LOC105441585 [Strongylocentrotus purpuratus]|uniref:Uncharacterized protein n=1 Tax=Strongylocentrotus purpuratus TaxID=7668 RepID=A0A7M7HJR7_STRPU|nr:uncharacterized protein LOC105441585 [Strongylocentrotus purpuratus]|eukprot:XP_011671135.1 PREDICTED: uncharacterized protein LOC105441585 [Strongylocentrotus purpuratus]